MAKKKDEAAPKPLQETQMTVGEPAAPTCGAWKIKLACKWATPFVTLEGVTGHEAEARKAMHDALDYAIQSVERTR